MENTTNNKGFDQKSTKNDWRTPPKLLKAIEAHFRTTLLVDACASEENKICPMFFTKKDDLLSIQNFTINSIISGIRDNYAGGQVSIFMNPPYNEPGKGIDSFIEKAVNQSRLANDGWIILIPASRTEQPWWHKLLHAPFCHIAFIEKRVSFLRDDGKPSKSPNHASVAVGIGEAGMIANEIHGGDISSITWR